MTRTMKIVIGALVLSIITNIFLIGFMAGVKRHIERSVHMTQTRDHRQLRGFTASAPDATRKEIRQSLRELRPRLHRNLEQSRQLRAEITELMQVDDFDREALTQKFDHLRTLREETQREMEKHILESLEKLNGEQRRAMVTQMKKKPH